MISLPPDRLLTWATRSLRFSRWIFHPVADDNRGSSRAVDTCFASTSGGVSGLRCAAVIATSR